MSVYGSNVKRYENQPLSLMAEPERSPAGNLVLRVGRENPVEGSGWHQTEHVVLTPDEADAFMEAVAVLRVTDSAWRRTS